MWEGYPDYITLRAYTPDRFTVFLHQIGYQGIIFISIFFVALIGVLTFWIKPKYVNKLNVSVLLIGVYALVTSLAWLLLPMIVLAR